MTKLINYLKDKKINTTYCEHYKYYKINDNDLIKFMELMRKSPLSYETYEIDDNKIEQILLCDKVKHKKYYSKLIKILTKKDDNLFKSFYYELEPIQLLSEGKSL